MLLARVHFERHRAALGDAQRGLEALGQALLQPGLTLTRSITTSMSCFSAFFSFGTSAASYAVPSTRKRT